jgi:hypothetical protein
MINKVFENPVAGWDSLWRIGNTKAAKMTIIAPFLPFLIEHTHAFVRLRYESDVSRLFPQSIDASNVNLLMIYYGLWCIMIGEIIYGLFCPASIKRHGDYHNFISEHYGSLSKEAISHMKYTSGAIEYSESREIIMVFFDRMRRRNGTARWACLISFALGIFLVSAPAIVKLLNITLDVFTISDMARRVP